MAVLDQIDDAAIPTSSGVICWVWQVKQGLRNIGQFDAVDTTISPKANDDLNGFWSDGGRSEYGDSLSDRIQSVTGKSDAQMIAFYVTCSGITR